jgi:hypothetical protein
MSLNNNTNRSRHAAVRALRRLSKAEALTQLVERPDLAANISAAARLWGVSRATVRAWLAEYAAMATPPAATDAAMAARPSPAEAVKAALSDLCDAFENISPQHVVDSCDEIEILGFHGDCQMAAAWLAAAVTMAEAALKRDY